MRAVKCVVIGLALAGCSASAGSLPLPSPDDPNCEETAASRVPGSPEDVLDPEPVLEWLRTRTSNQAQEDGGALAVYSVHYAPREEDRWVRVMSTTLPAESADALGHEILRALLFPEPPQQPDPATELSMGIPGSFRVEVAASPANPTIRFRPSVSCAPVMENRAALLARVQEAASRRSLRGSVQATVRIGESGRPDDIRLQGAEDDPEVRREALDILSGARFQPANLDGFPAPSWTRFPIVFGGG